jgi:hypothetical protein
MKALNLVVAASLAVVAGGVFADESVNLSHGGNVTDVPGRADVTAAAAADPVVTRPASEVTPGPIVEEGPIRSPIHATIVDVDKVSGRS